MSIITLEALRNAACRDADEFEAKVAKAKAYIARDLAKRQCAVVARTMTDAIDGESSR